MNNSILLILVKHYFTIFTRFKTGSLILITNTILDKALLKA